MSSQNKLTLWTDSTRSHYFLIPNDRELPNGDFILFTLNGSEKQVDATALTSFEISESEAKAYLQTEMNQAFEEAKNAFSNFMAFSTQTSQDVSSNPTPSSEKSQSAQTLISSLLGVSYEELQNNPETAQTAFQNVYTELKQLLGESTSTNPAKVEEARARMRSWREKLELQGIKVGEEMEELPDQLGEILSSSNLEVYLREIVAKLQDFADQINQSPDTVGEKIDEMIKSISKDLFVDKEKQLEEKRKQQYRKSAQDAIAESFSKRKSSSFTDGFLKLKTHQQSEDEPK
ncbi:hypothetical protein ACL6C3_12930 [Capilliphycus salinus ALCB114379]|uniref:hypothetical protein n=1 Tax=Capilliphycus salinus TaxID=2768948 RepID=UPI0039A64785